MSNMSYCKFQNTLLDMRDCFRDLGDLSVDQIMYDLSREEHIAAVELFRLCLEIAECKDELLYYLKGIK